MWVVWNFVHRIHKRDALLREAVDHVFVVDDFVVNINARPDSSNGFVQTFDGHVNASTEAARIGEEDFHGEKPLAVGN